MFSFNLVILLEFIRFVFCQNNNYIDLKTNDVWYGQDNVHIACKSNSTDIEVLLIKLSMKNATTTNYTDVVTIKSVPEDNFRIVWGSKDLDKRANATGSNINPGILNFGIAAENVKYSDGGTYQCKISGLIAGNAVVYRAQGEVLIKTPKISYKNEDCGLNTGQILGIAFGVVIGVTLISTIAGCIQRKMNKNKPIKLSDTWMITNHEDT